MRRFLRILKWAALVVGALFLLLGLAACGGYFYVKDSTTPTLDGSLELDGLENSATVEREPSGVVHIRAENEGDMFFALGAAHAQDRLWQMEFQRRGGAGRLSEVLGEATVGEDEFLRSEGFYRAAESSYESLSDESRATIDSYVEGINSYLATGPELPVEFMLLGYEPEEWRPADIVVWAKMMSLDLSANYESELTRHALRAEGVTPERIRELIPPYPEDAPTMISTEDLEEEEAEREIEPSSEVSNEVPGEASGDVSGEMSSGMPSESESEMSDEVSDEKSSGMPGEASSAMSDEVSSEAADEMPREMASEVSGEASGERSADERPSGVSGESESEMSDEPLGEVSDETAEQARALIEARESLPESLEASNNWVVSGEKTASGEPLLANDPHLGFQVPSLWHLAHLEAPGFEAVGATLPGLPAVVIGKNEDISWGVTNVGADVQDLYVMDKSDGGYIHDGETKEYETRTETIEVADGEPADIEVRETVHGPIISDVVDAAGENPLALRWTTLDDGDTTMDAFLGMNRAGNWDEFNEALRSYVAPSQNFVYSDVDGNIGYVAPGSFPIRADGHTGLAPASGDGESDWEGFIPFDEWPRAFNPDEGFIATANNKATPEGYPYDIAFEWAEPYRAARIRAMIEAKDDHTVEDMTEIQNDYKSLLFEDFRSVIEDMEPESENASEWRERLVEWDGVASPESREAAVFAAWYAELSRLPEAEVGEEFWDEPRYLLEALENGDPNCEPSTAEGCMEFASEAMERALEMFEGEPPEWSEEHRATFEHPVLGSTPLARLSNREVPFGGDASTVNVGSYDFSDFSMSGGPSYRHVVDMSEGGESVFIHPMGQSGNVLSGGFDDLLDMWVEGGVFADADFGLRGRGESHPRSTRSGGFGRIDRRRAS